MKRLLSERFYTYWADTEHSCTVRITIKMRDSIDKGLMQEALVATGKRYPYYKVRLNKVSDANGSEYYVLEETELPWVVMPTEKPATLLSSESNDHLLAFSCWDDCIALDFFHALTDGIGSFNLMRTLMYEYCRRRYDSKLSREGIRVEGDDISPDEWADPASQPQPDDIKLVPVPPISHPINLIADSVVPLNNDVETVCLKIDEKQMMQYVKSHDTSPATLTSLLIARAIARLHPEINNTEHCSDTADETAPVVALAINQRPALGTPQTGVSLASALRLSLTREIREMNDDQQQSTFRKMVTLLSNAGNIANTFWQTQNKMDMLERIPNVIGRHQAMTAADPLIRTSTTCALSYVGKANFGAAEQYINRMYSEAWAPYALTVHLTAAGGQFIVSWMQRFSTDDYLNAFIDEIRRLEIDVSIICRQDLTIANIDQNFNR